MTLTLHKSQVHCSGVMQWLASVHSCPLLWRGCKCLDLVNIQNPLKPGNYGNLGKMCENLRKIAVVWIYRNGTQNQSAEFFIRSCFLGKLGWNSGKNGAWSALISKNAPNMKWNAFVFLEVIFHFLEFIRASLGKFGQKSFAPPKICLLLHLCLLRKNNMAANLQKFTSSYQCCHFRWADFLSGF